MSGPSLIKSLFILSLILISIGLCTCDIIKKNHRPLVELTSIRKSIGSETIRLDKEMPYTIGTPMGGESNGTNGGELNHKKPVIVSDMEDASGRKAPVQKIMTTKTIQTSNMDWGEIVYRVPDTMIVFVTYKIIVRISRSHGSTEIIEGIGTNPVRTEIPVSSKMEVVLIDTSPDSAFIIKRINSDGQIIDSLEFTEWQFFVKPIKHGQRQLDLVVSLIKDGDVKQKIYSDTIHVKNNPAQSSKNFWNDNWKWLATTIIIPLIVFFWKRKKKE